MKQKVILVILFGCIFGAPSISHGYTNNQDIEYEKKMPLVIEDDELNNRHHVFLVSEETGDTAFFATIDNIYIDHHHPIQYAGRRLFVITREIDRLGYFEGISLWVYYHQDSKKRLYGSQGSIDFSVSAKSDFIAIFDAEAGYLQIEEIEGSYDNEFYTDEFTNYKGEKLEENELRLLSWSDSTYRIYLFAWPHTVYEIDLSSSWNISKYMVFVDGKHYNYYDEWDFNATRGLFIYSDCPTFLGADDYEEFKKTPHNVALFTYSIYTQKIRSVEIAESKCFNPVWNDSNHYSYDDPYRKGRITEKYKY